MKTINFDMSANNPTISIVNPTISIVIPAYNEEARIGNTLNLYLNYFNNVEILIAMDGCKDRTLDIVKTFAQNGNKNNNIVRYIYFDERLGKGKGLLNALNKVGGGIVAITDADSSTSPSEIFKLINNLDDCDCVIGSRWMKGSIVAVKQPLKRRIASRGFNLLVRILLGLDFKDTQCGTKIFRKEVIEDVANDISTFNYAFDVDLLLQIKKKGFKIKEIPIIWNDQNGTSVKLHETVITMFLAIMRLKIINSKFKFLVDNNLSGIQTIK